MSRWKVFRPTVLAAIVVAGIVAVGANASGTFVEPGVQVLYELDGASHSGSYGWAVSQLRDVNHDGATLHRRRAVRRPRSGDRLKCRNHVRALRKGDFSLRETPNPVSTRGHGTRRCGSEPSPAKVRDVEPCVRRQRDSSPARVFGLASEQLLFEANPDS
jgi:hypothetical protein